MVSKPQMKRFCVIDGQGGGIGAALIKSLKETYGESVELIGLGTNAIASAQMLKAGANAIVQTVRTADLILGPIAITWANAMLGEVTANMAAAISSSPAPKILLPLTQEPVVVAGVVLEPLPHMVQRIVNKIIKEVLPDV